MSVAGFIMSGWLKNFPYRTDIGARTFIWAGVEMLIIAFLSDGFYAGKAASSNPAEKNKI